MRSIQNRPRGRRAGTSPVFPTALVWCVCVSPLAAQEAGTSRWLPSDGGFAPLVADPLEPRFGAALIASDLFAPGKERIERAPFELDRPPSGRTELHGTAALGGRLPVWRADGAGGAAVVIGIQTGVVARFRIATSSNDNVGTDWMVALPIELARDRTELRFRLLHRSSHLGDELMQDAGVRRIIFDHEGVDLLAGYRPVPSVRVYGGGTVILRSTTTQNRAMRRMDRGDGFALQAGTEAEWHPWGHGRIGVLGALDWQGAERTRWQSAFSFVGGLTARGPTRTMHLLLRYFTGPSPMHQFFLTDETFWGIELKVQL